MRKHTPNRLLTDAFREIKNTLSRFLSLFLLSALAVAFLSGLRTTAPDMEYTADDYYDRTHLMDLRVLSTLGITDGDVAALAAAPGVEKAEGAWYVDATVHAAQNDYVVRLHSLSELGINDPELLEGRLPQGENECVVEPALLSLTGLAIGDALTLDTAGTDYDDALRTETYTIVGTVNTSLYLSMDRGTSTIGTGRLSAVAFLPRAAFDLEVYTEAYLLAADAAPLICYSDAYQDKIDALSDSLEPLADRRAAARYDSVIGEANEKLNDAQREYDDARAEADAELADAAAELADARQKLDDGWAEYRDGVATLERETADAEQKIADAEVELADALAELNDGEAQYADGRAELDDGWAQYEQGLSDYEDGRQTLLDGEAAYEENRKALDDAQDQYDQGLADYEAGQQALLDGEAAYEENRKALDDAQDQYGRGMAQLSASLTALRTALRTNPATAALADLEDGPLLAALKNTPMASDPQVAPLFAAWDELTAAKEQLDAGRQALAEGRAELDAGWAQAADAKAQLDDARAQLEAGKQALAEGRAELDDGWAQAAAAKAELDDALTELNDGEAGLDDARKKLDDGWAEYRQGLADLGDARERLPRETADAQAKLDDALAELNDGEAEYQDGLLEYEDGRREAEEKLSDAQAEIDDARAQVADIEPCEWYLLDRNTNTGYVSFQQDAQRMGNLGDVFPLIFFLVAALVCLTTMTRMVEEQRVQIGGLKALGYSRGAIALKYVGYGFLASFGGGLVGLLVGCTLIPTIIFNAWKVMYTVGDLQITLFPGIYALALGAAVVSVTGTALASSFAALTAVPASLMRPRAPQAGKRVFLEHVPFLWKRLSFTWKVTVRNLFRYQKRFWMTVIGIGGCTALLITGLGLRDAVHAIFDKQYDEITTYHGQISLTNRISEAELNEITAHLDSQPLVETWATVSTDMITAEGPRRSMDSYVYLFAITDQQRFGSFVHLRDRHTGQAVPLPDDGAVITEKLAEMLGVKVGDSITLVDADNSRASVSISGIAENYVFHYIYLSHSAYTAIYGHEPEVNSIMLRYTEDTEANSDAVAAGLIPLSGVSSVTRTDTLRQQVLRGLQGVDYAVVVVVVAAAALAFVVLYNLTNINITERMRELATLKVLGFYEGELSAYVYRENVFLTLFGILLGLVMGKYLHQWLVLTVEIDMAMFGREAKPMSYLLSVLLTILFSALVNLAARFRLRKLDMVESLKTVE